MPAPGASGPFVLAALAGGVPYIQDVGGVGKLYRRLMDGVRSIFLLLPFPGPLSVSATNIPPLVTLSSVPYFRCARGEGAWGSSA